MKKLPRGILAFLVLLGTPLSLAAWNAQLVMDVLPTAALAPAAAGGLMQTETTEVSGQVAVSHAQPIVEGLSLSGTAWGMADSLPTGIPFDTPPAKLDLQSRLLELKLAWEAIPGTLIWDAGKKVIHPSSGFFRTPLNVISHGALGNTANLSGGAVGTSLTALLGSFTISNFFSPRLAWSPGADQVFQYITSRQEDYQDLTQLDVRIGDADVRLLGLLSSGGPASADPALHVTAGVGVDSNIGEALTVRAEATIADSQDRLAVTSDQPLAVAVQTVSWAPRALVGLTWTNKDQLSVMAEYCYNGLGFGGDDYAKLITYSQALHASGAGGPDLLDQFGTFQAAQHYGFFRVSGKIDDRLSAAGWTTVNLQDLSGLTGIVLTLAYPAWTVNASLLNAWGNSDTEAGLSPLLWKVDLEVSVFL